MTSEYCPIKHSRRAAIRWLKLFGSLIETLVDDLAQTILVRAIEDGGELRQGVTRCGKSTTADFLRACHMVPVPSEADRLARDGRGTDSAIAALERRRTVDIDRIRRGLDLTVDLETAIDVARTMVPNKTAPDPVGRGPKGKDIAGQVFDRLTAISVVAMRGGRRIWRFNCSCGNSHECPAKDVLSGRVRSCGCLKRQIASERASTGSLATSSAKARKVRQEERVRAFT